MSDILKGLTGGWSFLLSWIFPSALAWSVFALFLFPKLRHAPIFGDIAATSSANQTLVLLGAVIMTGLLLSSFSTVLYRVVEAYYLIPAPIANWLRKRQKNHQKKLINQLQELRRLRKDQKQSPGDCGECHGGSEASIHQHPQSVEIQGSNTSQTGIDVKIGLLRELLRRYPLDDGQLGPTQFANSLRAIETYGLDRYRLDSQTLWSELLSVVPDSLRTEEENARAPINFSVSMMYLSGLLGILCFIIDVSVTGLSIAPIIVGGIALLLVPVWYRLAVLSTRYLSSVVQAIVNVGRIELARKMGLTIPRNLQDERDMWEQVCWFIIEQFDEEHVFDLDSYRLENKRGRLALTWSKPM